MSNNLEFRLRDAGHILGSAIVELWVKSETGRERKIVFSGDLGHRGQRIVKDPDMISEADYVIVESTYGTRYHKSRDETVLEMLGILKSALDKNGVVLIPSFAVERAQEILYELNLFYRNKLMKDLAVYLDSPMAIEATEVFRKYENDYDEDAKRLVESGDKIFDFPGLRFSLDSSESRKLSGRSGIIIIAGSGMCNGGRIRHHLSSYLGKSSTSVMFVGFQVPGTLGRRLVDGAKNVKIFGHKVDVKASVHTLGGFSAHADERDLRYWLRGFGRMPRKVFVVHGDEDVATAFAGNIKQELRQDTYVPSMMEEFEIV